MKHSLYNYISRIVYIYFGHAPTFEGTLQLLGRQKHTHAHTKTHPHILVRPASKEQGVNEMNLYIDVSRVNDFCVIS